MTKRSEEKSPPEHSGIIATTPELMELRAEARRCRIDAAGKVKTTLAGPFRSSFRGRGMEFEEVRAYQPGDDPRTIDWRVTARSGRVFSKLYNEERERPLLFLVDGSESMRFGTRGSFKSVAAARAAACLAWAGIDAGDRIGGIVRFPGGHVEIPPRRGKRRVFAFMQALARGTAEKADGETRPLARQIARLRRMAPPGSRVFVVSDFYEMDEDCRVQLGLLARRCELTCVVVYDVLEESPPPPGTYRVSDGSETITFTAKRGSWRDDYTKRMAVHREAVRGFARKNGVHVIALRTDQETAPVLARSLGARSARKTDTVSLGGAA